MNENIQIFGGFTILFTLIMVVIWFLKDDNEQSGEILTCRDEPSQWIGQILSFVFSAVVFILISWYNGMLKSSWKKSVICIIILLYIFLPEILSKFGLLDDPDVDCDTEYNINDISYWKDTGFKLIKLIVSLIYFGLIISIIGSDSVSFKTGIAGKQVVNLTSVSIISILLILFLVGSSMYTYNNCDEKDSDKFIRTMIETKSTILMISVSSLLLLK